MPANTGPLDLSTYITGVTNQANKDWGRADDQYQWAKDQYAKDRGVTDQVTQQALDTQKKYAGYSDEDRAFWTGTYKPAMQQQMDFAREYTTPGRMEANRGSAMAGSNLAFDTNADMAKRNLSSFGVDPASGRYAGLDAGLAAKRAAGAAAAGTKSDRDTEALGQEYLDRAIRTGAALPGQAANEAGVGMAAGNQAVNAGLATTASGASTMGSPMAWAGLGNDMYKEWSRAAQAETSAGMQQNEMKMKQDQAEQGKSSGIGALVGAGAGILGSIYGGPIGGAVGSKLGGMLGGAMSGGGGGGSGTLFRRGGPVKQFRAGGPVTPRDDDDDDEMATTEPVYRPGQDDRPEMQREYQPMPGERTQRDIEHDWTSSDTEDEEPQYQGEGRYEGEPEQPNAPPPRYQWGPNYAAGGNVDHIPDYIRPYQEFADGGDVMDEEELVDNPEEEMAEPEAPPAQGPVVPPEASPSGGAETDDVHALLNEGEFVVPKDVVRWYGEKFMQKLIQKAHDEMAQPQEAEPEMGPPTAMAIAPPSFQTAGA